MSINTRFDKVLEAGETIRWSGSAQPYSILDKSCKQTTIMAVCWAIALEIVLVGGYYWLSVSRELELQTGVLLFCALFPLIIVWRPISDKNKVKKLLYAVTSTRAIVLSAGEEKPISMPLATIDAVSVDPADNGNCHVRLGSAIMKASAKKLPFLAYRGELTGEDPNKVCVGLVFFNVRGEDAKTIQSLLKTA